MIWHWPQISLAAAFGISIFGGMILNGTPRKPWSFDGILAGVLIEAIILYFGGFWTGCAP